VLAVFATARSKIMGEVVGYAERAPKAWCQDMWIQGHGHSELF